MVQPHYAVKSNPQPAIVDSINQAGFGFDCATEGEIRQIRALGVDASRIIFANPCKPLSHIEYAREQGIKQMTFDSTSELHKIKHVFPDAELVLRLWVDDKDAQCQLSNKYGASLEEVGELLALAKDLRLKVTGVSFHVGSGADVNSFDDALENARWVFQIGHMFGHKMTLLDIGGGFPGSSCGRKTFADAAGVIKRALKNYWHDWASPVKMISEPGRFFCAESQTLATQVIGKRVRGGMRSYYINEGVYQSFNCMLYDHSVLLEEEGSCADGSVRHKSAIFGQTCDGLDQISTGMYLPDMRVGDWLVVPTMGAYTNGAASNFNGFASSNTIVLN
jgi:ornithine decarboxylase